MGPPNQLLSTAFLTVRSFYSRSPPPLILMDLKVSLTKIAMRIGHLALSPRHKSNRRGVSHSRFKASQQSMPYPAFWFTYCQYWSSGCSVTSRRFSPVSDTAVSLQIGFLTCNKYFPPLGTVCASTVTETAKITKRSCEGSRILAREGLCRRWMGELAKT